MKITPTIVLKYDWNNGIAFEGKAASDFLKLMDGAVLVEWKHTNEHGYHWHRADKDDCKHPNIEVKSAGIAGALESASVRTRLEQAERTIERHKDMIDAAEALDPFT